MAMMSLLSPQNGITYYVVIVLFLIKNDECFINVNVRYIFLLIERAQKDH